MMDCDEVQTTLLLGEPLVAEAEAHLAACARCAADRADLHALAGVLAASRVPEPPAALSSRVLGAAGPPLARHARRVLWLALARALGVALLALPALALADALLVRTAYEMLSAVLPSTLSLYIVAYYAAMLTLLFALTYGAIPIVAEHQARPRFREAHG